MSARAAAVASAVVVAAAVGAVGPSIVSGSGLLAALVLIGCTVASTIRRRRRPGRPMFGLVFVAALPLVLGIGAAVNHPAIALEETNDRTWLLIAVGTAAFAIAAQIARPCNRGSPGESDARPRLGKQERLMLEALTATALLVAGVNLATGDIALLSEHITATRFSGDFGVLEKLWPLVFGVLQASCVVRVVGRRRGLRSIDVVVLGLTSVVFALSAGRAFVALPVGAIAIEIFERRRTSLPTVFALLLGGVLLAGALGYARTSAEVGELTSNAALRQQSLPSGPIGSTLQSLVVGPRVLSRTIVVVPGDITHRTGGFLLADAMNFIDSSVERSDRWVTRNIMDRTVDVVGGQPPTVLGGFWIDFGWSGVVFGMSALAWTTQTLYARSRNQPSAPRSAEFAFWSAYLMLSLYSYVSVKPQIVAAFVVFRLCAFAGRRTERAIEPSRVVVGA